MSSALFVTLKARRQASKLFENHVHVVQVLHVLVSHRKAHLIDIKFPEIVLIALSTPVSMG